MNTAKRQSQNKDLKLLVCKVCIVEKVWPES